MCRQFLLLRSSPLARRTPGPMSSDSDLIADHPRSRGEHRFLPAQALRARRSSPLARRTHCIGCSSDIAEPIIPARAENTGLMLSLLWGIADHPRSRGEHALGFVTNCSSARSSPLARRTHRARVHAIAARPIIPARAENTPVLSI